MTIFSEPIGCLSSAAPQDPRDLIVMHGGGGGVGGGGNGGHGGHGGGWIGGGWGGDGGGGSGGCGGGGSGDGGNWALKIALFLVVAYIVLTGLGVIGH